MKIAVVCVNYNSYSSLLDYTKSIDIAVSNSLLAGEDIEVSLFVADNSEIKIAQNLSKYNHINCEVKQFKNLGYLGGAFRIINNMQDRHSYDYIIISNVDVLINKDFFSQLANIPSDNIGWIAPGIYKPQMQKICKFEWGTRPSVKRMKLYSFLFAHPAIYSVYYVLSRLKIKSEANLNMNNRCIYAGYGSFMIFSKEFMATRKAWDYEPFLFGEEIYFGELVRLANLKVLYVPTLQISDVGKVSTGRMSALGKLKVQKVSNDYLLKTFFINDCVYR